MDHSIPQFLHFCFPLLTWCYLFSLIYPQASFSFHWFAWFLVHQRHSSFRDLDNTQIMAWYCSSCGVYQTSSSFSHNQWAKGNSVSYCMSCVCQLQIVHHTTGYESHAISSMNVPIYHHHMGYVVVIPTPPSSRQCNKCHQHFNSQNELNMHMQVHCPHHFHWHK